MMSTWLPPTSGTIEIAGHDVVREPLAVRRSLGYLPEHNALYDTMRVDRFLRFMGKARGLSGGLLQERIDPFVELLRGLDVRLGEKPLQILEFEAAPEDRGDG